MYDDCIACDRQQNGFDIGILPQELFNIDGRS
jgi:hypothetical protein